MWAVKNSVTKLAPIFRHHLHTLMHTHTHTHTGRTLEAPSTHTHTNTQTHTHTYLHQIKRKASWWRRPSNHANSKTFFSFLQKNILLKFFFEVPSFPCHLVLIELSTAKKRMEKFSFLICQPNLYCFFNSITFRYVLLLNLFVFS